MHGARRTREPGGIEPKLLSPTFEPLASTRAESLARPRFNSLFLGTFSVLALTLAAVGIFGLLSYSVATRRVELGVRAAFGADQSAFLRLVVREGMTLTGVGLLPPPGVSWRARLMGSGLRMMLNVRILSPS